jgi:hypothetical protein
VPLRRSAFARFDAELLRAYEGRLTRVEAERLFEELVATAVVELEVGAMKGGRAAMLHAMLRENSGCTLGDLARALNVSYTAASHLFARSVASAAHLPALDQGSSACAPPSTSTATRRSRRSRSGRASPTRPTSRDRGSAATA